MIYRVNDCPINEEVWLAGIRFSWLETDDIPKPVFNCHPIKGKVITLGDEIVFQYECLDKVCSINLTYMDMLCYVLADTPEEAAQGYNNIIYKYNYKLNEMQRNLGLYRIKNVKGVF